MKTCHPRQNFLTGFLVAALLFVGVAGGIQARDPDLLVRMVPIVAVNQDGSDGQVGEVTVKLIPGKSNILVETDPFLALDLQFSANTAVVTALQETHNFNPGKDFIVSYDINSDIVGGGSAGAATTLATIAALEDREIKEGVAITGTVLPDGSIGPVSGVLLKAKAVADAGYTVFLIPKDQSVVYEENQGPVLFLDPTAVLRTIDIKAAAELWGLEIIEVETIKDAEEHLFV